MLRGRSPSFSLSARQHHLPAAVSASPRELLASSWRFCCGRVRQTTAAEADGGQNFNVEEALT